MTGHRCRFHLAEIANTTTATIDGVTNLQHAGAMSVTANSSALIVTISAPGFSARAISGVVRMAQADPSLTPLQSYRPSGAAIVIAFSTSSSVMRLRRCAFGFSAPLSWLFTEMCAIARLRSLIETLCFAA